VCHTCLSHMKNRKAKKMQLLIKQEVASYLVDGGARTGFLIH